MDHRVGLPRRTDRPGRPRTLRGSWLRDADGSRRPGPCCRGCFRDGMGGQRRGVDRRAGGPRAGRRVRHAWSAPHGAHRRSRAGWNQHRSALGIRDGGLPARSDSGLRVVRVGRSARTVPRARLAARGDGPDRASGSGRSLDGRFARTRPAAAARAEGSAGEPLGRGRLLYHRRGLRSRLGPLHDGSRREPALHRAHHEPLHGSHDLHRASRRRHGPGARPAPRRDLEHRDRHRLHAGLRPDRFPVVDSGPPRHPRGRRQLHDAGEPDRGRASERRGEPGGGAGPLRSPRSRRRRVVGHHRRRLLRGARAPRRLGVGGGPDAGVPRPRPLACRRGTRLGWGIRGLRGPGFRIPQKASRRARGSSSRAEPRPPGSREARGAADPRSSRCPERCSAPIRGRTSRSALPVAAPGTPRRRR